MRQTKFWLSVSAFLVGSVFLYLGVINEETWKQVLIWIFGLYGASNVTATFAHNSTGRTVERSEPLNKTED